MESANPSASVSGQSSSLLEKGALEDSAAMHSSLSLSTLHDHACAKGSYTHGSPHFCDILAQYVGILLKSYKEEQIKVTYSAVMRSGHKRPTR
jgi:hypothetical protein